MNNDFVARPRLIEPGVKYFLNGTLKECRRFKDKHATILFNIIMVFVLIVVVGGFLMYKYKGKLTPTEVYIKNRKKKEYIISKLQQLAYLRKTQSQSIITNLPEW